MLRVAHVLRKYDPSEWGGTETHVVAISEHLAANGVASEIHAPRGPRAPDRALPATVPLRRFHAFAPFLGDAAQRRALWQNAGNLATLDEPVRLIADRGLALAHLHTAGRIGGAVRTAMRLTGRPYLVSIHGPRLSAPDVLGADTARRLRGLVDLGRPLGALLGARRVLSDAARVLCFNRDELVALQGVVGDRAVQMDHGVDRTRLASGDVARARARWPALVGPVVLLIGRLCAQKNQRLAVAAIARVPDARLVLAGAATDAGYREQIEADAAAAGVADRVHLLGNLSPTDIPDLLALASLVIVPSTHEAFGLAVLEAWAANRTVVFAGHSGLAELGRAFGHDPPAIRDATPAAWAAAIRTRLEDRGRRDAEAEVGARLVAARYAWPRIAAQLASLYAEVLAEPRRAA